MHDLEPFARLVLGVSLGILVALVANRLAALIRVPAPALLLAAAAGAAAIAPDLGSLRIVTDQRIVTVALIVILFDGGLQIGWSRMRPVLGAVLWLGIVGTVVTAGALAVAAHLLLGFDWRPALLLGAALAPTDPAVVFSVLGGRAVRGRSGTLLEGESGANDPVGIALMVSLLASTGGGSAAVWHGVGRFALQLGVGAAVGAIGGWLLIQLVRRVPTAVPLPVVTLTVALTIYGVATVAEGSGYLAVFLAGILFGDVEVPHRAEIRRFAGVLSSVAEIVAFVALGLSVQLGAALRWDRVGDALIVGLLLVAVIRPLLVGLVITPVRLRREERVFVLFGGLKGAVPILLGTYVLLDGAPRAGQIYDVVFVVVLLTVALQGALLPVLARRFDLLDS